MTVKIAGRGNASGNWLCRLTFSAVRSASRTAAAAKGSVLGRMYRAVLNFSCSDSFSSMATAAWWRVGRLRKAYPAAAIVLALSPIQKNIHGRGRLTEKTL